MSEEFVIDGFDYAPVEQTELGALDVYADIVYCIDLTSSMKPIIDKVKSTALTLHKDLQEVMQTNYQRKIKQMRIKVIGFRDAYCDGRKSFEVSDFFYLPDEAESFKNFVDGLQPKGGGDIPENSLEALAMAMQSDWCKPIDPAIRKRHVIVLFTDAPAHPLEKSQYGIDRNYPKGMPESYSELIDWWCGQGALSKENNVNMDQIAKRLAVFAPESCPPWSDVYEDFDACIKHDVVPDRGGSDIATDNLLKMLGETMA